MTEHECEHCGATFASARSLYRHQDARAERGSCPRRGRSKNFSFDVLNIGGFDCAFDVATNRWYITTPENMQLLRGRRYQLGRKGSLSLKQAEEPSWSEELTYMIAETNPDFLKRHLNQFPDRVHANKIADLLGARYGSQLFRDLADIYPMERFWSPKGERTRNWKISDREHQRRLEILDALPDNCGWEGVGKVLKIGARQTTKKWIMAYYDGFERLGTDSKLPAVVGAMNAGKLADAGYRFIAVKTTCKTCCEPGCNQKVDGRGKLYRCKKHFERFLKRL